MTIPEAMLEFMLEQARQRHGGDLEAAFRCIDGEGNDDPDSLRLCPHMTLKVEQTPV